MANGKTILIVDDDRDLAESLRAMLNRQGYLTFVGQNGFEAKQLIAEHRPDLVVLDMAMPRLGGYPVLDHFHNQPDAPLFIAINSSEGSRHRAYAELLGAVDYIRKPFAIERLLDSVQTALAGVAEPPEGDGHNR